MKARTKSPRLCPPLPLLKGERMEVRGSELVWELKPQTLTLPSPLRRERRINAPNASKEALKTVH